MSDAATFQGIVYREQDEDDLEILVRFTGKTGYDLHPYGSTYARQDWAEIEDVSEISVNGQPVSLQYLTEIFGKEGADKIIEEAEDKAEKVYE